MSNPKFHGVISPNNEVWIDDELQNWDEQKFQEMRVPLIRWALTDTECEKKIINGVLFSIFPTKSKHKKHKFINPFKGRY